MATEAIEECPKMGEAGHCGCWDDDNGETCCFCDDGRDTCQDALCCFWEDGLEREVINGY